MDFIQGINRNQLFLMNLDDHVAQDSWARIIELFVDSFDLDKLGFCDVLQKQGRPPFHNSVLLKIFDDVNDNLYKIASHCSQYHGLFL